MDENPTRALRDSGLICIVILYGQNQGGWWCYARDGGRKGRDGIDYMYEFITPKFVDVCPSFLYGILSNSPRKRF